MTQSPTASMHGLRDNHSRGSVAEFLKHRISDGSALSVVSAYFTIHAYDALKANLDNIDRLRFLFGEPRFIGSLDPEKTERKSFAIEDDGLELLNRLQQRQVAFDCARWLTEKVDIRSVIDANFIHGKMYHIDDGRREHAIVGSSNFTRRGLGISGTPNIELNLIVDSDRDRADLKSWFDALWNDQSLVSDVKGEVLRYLEQLYVNHPPEFIYFKTLYHIFERFISGEDADAALFEQTAIVDTDVWKALFDFQKDGAKGAIHKINAHNGCILADSVGLGKTYSALAVIKYFELRNHRVLVLCPKKLRDNWTVFLAQNNSDLNPFLRDRFSYTVLSHTDLSRETGKVDGVDLATINWSNFDLVVIDESHNFRNNTKGKRDEDGNIVRKSRYERLMDDVIKKGVRTKVLLLSATPVNNDLRDLRNQIYFVTEGRDSAFAPDLAINSIKDTLSTAQKTFMEWARRRAERNAVRARSATYVAFDKFEKKTGGEDNIVPLNTDDSISVLDSVSAQKEAVARSEDGRGEGPGRSTVNYGPVGRPQSIPKPEFVAAMCPHVAPYVGNSRPSWPAMIEGAYQVAGRWGLNQTAWSTLCQHLGREWAAITVLTVAELPASRFTQSNAPTVDLRRAAYVGGIVKKLRKGEDISVMASWKRHVKIKQAGSLAATMAGRDY